MTLLLPLLLACGSADAPRGDAPAPPAREPQGPRLPEGATEIPEAWRCEGDPPPMICFQPVPGATFRRGAQAEDPSAPNHDPRAGEHEGPVRDVTVSPFWILRHEVNTSHYAHCVSAGACSEDDLERGPGATYGREGHLDHPLNFVSWHGADRFCRWLGGRLPTEAEWELAARGTDGRIFPWGDEPGCGVGAADPSKPWDRVMVQAPCRNDAPRVPADLFGVSPYDLVGMGGNVWEWVADWYAPDAYATSPAVDPAGPAEGTAKVQRGGGFADEDPWELRAAARMAMPPESRLVDVGFRCAWTPPR